MSNNENQGRHEMKMMWLMMLPCMLMPIIFVVLAGKGFGGFSWQIFAGIAIMVGVHLLLMKGMHGGSGKSCHRSEAKAEDKAN